MSLRFSPALPHCVSNDRGVREIAGRSFSGAFVYFLVIAVAAASTDILAVEPAATIAAGIGTFLLGCARVLFALRIQREEAPGPFAIRALIGAILATCLVWGCFAGFAARGHLTEWRGTFILISTAAFAAGATNSLAPVRHVAWAGVSMLSAPVIAGAAMRGDAPGFGFAAMSCVYWAFLMVQTHQGSSVYWAAIHSAESEKEKKIAELKAEARSLLLARMTHEIRTPMNGVIGMLELLRSTELTPEQREYAGYSLSSALNLRDVLNSILEFSRNEKVGIALNAAPFEIRPWLDNTLAPFRFEAAAKGLHFVTSVDGTLARSYTGDATQLAQVMRNLVSNAVKFTKSGSIRVSIEPLPGKEGVLSFWVVDTGVGMSETTRAQLFDPFIHGDQPVSAAQRGAGLGLAITRQLIDGMGGTIAVKSSPGAGSCFQFAIPIESASPATATDPSGDGQATPAFSGYRLLVVDDDAVNRRTLAGLAEKLGATTEQAIDGGEALEAIRRRPFDLVLMDLRMPGMNGVEAARAIRLLDGGANKIPVVIISASVTSDYLAGLKEEAINDAISKPISLGGLAELMKRHGGKPAQGVGA